VRDLLSKGQKHILLNLGMSPTSTAPASVSWSAHSHAKNQGGELKLLNLTRKSTNLLQITKLYTVFDVKDDEASAIASFKK